MTTDDTGDVPYGERDQKIRSLFSTAVRKGITDAALQGEVSHDSHGAEFTVCLDKYESFDVRFEIVSGDVIFARLGKRILIVGNLWDEAIEEKITSTVKKAVAREFSAMPNARPVRGHAA